MTVKTKLCFIRISEVAVKIIIETQFNFRRYKFKMSKLETKIGFVGGGAMAQAIAEGLIMSGTVDPVNIMASATSSRFKDWWTSRYILNCVYILFNHF